MTEGRTKRVVFQPATYLGIQRGINQIVDAVRPTLGPRPRVVAIDRVPGGRMPELLDNGGVIARRITELPDRDENTGAMLIRHLLWSLREQVGDGTATAAVLFQSIYNQGLRYIIAGGNAMRLRHGLETGMQVIVDELTRMTVHLQGKEALAQIAESICYDPSLAEILGEIFDIIGAYGQLEVRSGRTRGLEREYIEGMYWPTGLLSREMIADPAKRRTEMENAGILISDLVIEEPRQLLPVINMALEANLHALMIVAGELSESAIGLLVAHEKRERFQAIGVKTPGQRVDEQAAALEDLVILTGGRPLLKVTGDTLRGIKPADLGRARRAWATLHHFGIVGGKGDPRVLRQHIADLRAAFGRVEDRDQGKELQQRIGKLMGGSATLRVGGATKLEITERKERAERTAEVLRGAVREGVLPGGGTALLACRPALQQRLGESTDPVKRVAYRILSKAVEEPIRTIITNAGYDASKAMADIDSAGPGHGFDVATGQVVDMAQAGLYDAATVQQAVVRGAITSAALALTIDVLIHPKEPEAVPTKP